MNLSSPSFNSAGYSEEYGNTAGGRKRATRRKRAGQQQRLRSRAGSRKQKRNTQKRR